MAVEQRLREFASGVRLTSELCPHSVRDLNSLAHSALGLTRATLNPRTSVKGDDRLPFQIPQVGTDSATY